MLILIGPQGSGKGTQAELIAKKYNAVHLSTGELFRASADPRVHELLERGQLIDDVTTAKLLGEQLNKLDDKQKIILDGYPRTMEQVKLLDDLLGTSTKRIAKVIMLDLPKDETMKRLLKRARKDDTEEAIMHRLNQFESETKPVIEHYQKLGIVDFVDGQGSIEEIFSRIQKVLPWQ